MTASAVTITVVTNVTLTEVVAVVLVGEVICNAGVAVMIFVLVCGVVVHTVDEIDPLELSNICCVVAFEFTQETPQRIWSKDFAPLNIKRMAVTADMSHTDKSWLNEVASRNMKRMSLTADTSHADRSWLKLTAR